MTAAAPWDTCTRGIWTSPLAVIHNDSTVVVNYAWRGLAVSGVDVAEHAGPCLPGSCTNSSTWAGQSQAGVYFDPGPSGGTPSGTPTWMGTLLANGASGGGLLYRRNRYYDPATGQFTQEDPIGFGGGTNLYGFANGDPVNATDPFGLCSEGDGWAGCPWGSEAGASSTEFWANLSVSGSNSLVRGAATVAGVFSALWTPQTATNTGLVLAGGGAAGVGLALARGAAAADEIAAGPMQAMERQFARGGAKSLRSTIKTLTKNIVEHEAKITEALKNGGDTSSMEREIRAWQETIRAAQKVLEKNP